MGISLVPKKDFVLENIFFAQLEVSRGPRNSFVTLEFAKMNIFNARLNDKWTSLSNDRDERGLNYFAWPKAEVGAKFDSSAYSAHRK